MGGYIGAKTGTLVASASDIRGDISATDTTPEITLKNTTETDADGTRSGKITFKGEQSGGEESILAQIQGSHDGTADDEKGDLIFKTNDGNDALAPTERLRINSAGDVLVSSPDPSLTITNTTHEDSDGGRESTIVFQGEQSGGELSRLAEIEVSHQGTADDEKGNIKIKVNDGNDGVSPTLSTEITSDGGVHIKPELQSPLIVENPATNSAGAYIKIRDGNSTASQHTWLGRSTHDTYLYANNNDLGFKITGGSSGSGIVTMPNQPSFQVHPTSDQSNIAINSQVTVVFGSERFDVGANFAGSQFTAPATGKYQLNVELRINNMDSAATYYHLYLITSNRSYFTIADPNYTSDLAYHSISTSIVADMDANDTTYVALYQANGAAQSAISSDSNFSGILIG